MQGNPSEEYLYVRYGTAFLTPKDAALRLGRIRSVLLHHVR